MITPMTVVSIIKGELIDTKTKGEFKDITIPVQLPPGQYLWACNKKHKTEFRLKRFSFVGVQVVMLVHYDSTLANNSRVPHSGLAVFVYLTMVI
jgi:hypothetical protein